MVEKLKRLTPKNPVTNRLFPLIVRTDSVVHDVSYIGFRIVVRVADVSGERTPLLQYSRVSSFWGSRNRKFGCGSRSLSWTQRKLLCLNEAFVEERIETCLHGTSLSRYSFTPLLKRPFAACTFLEINTLFIFHLPSEGCCSVVCSPGYLAEPLVVVFTAIFSYGIVDEMV